MVINFVPNRGSLVAILKWCHVQGIRDCYGPYNNKCSLTGVPAMILMCEVTIFPCHVVVDTVYNNCVYIHNSGCGEITKDALDYDDWEDLFCEI